MSTCACNVIICGLGGQGILKSSEIVARAAMRGGMHVKKSEIHGMSQRGGSVESHVRFGTHVESPLIVPQSADYLLAFDREEGERQAFYLRDSGTDLTPLLGMARAAVPTVQYLNTFLTGLLSAYLPFQESVWLEALHESLYRSVPENESVFRTGRAAGRQQQSAT